MIRTLVFGALVSLSGIAPTAVDAAQPGVFFIPAEPLPEALRQYAQLTGLHIVYESSIATGRTSHQVPEGLSPPAAMARLLSGTELSFVFLNASTVKIFQPPPMKPPESYAEKRAPVGSSTGLDEVVVTATKRPELLDKVPMSASVLLEQDIEEQGIHTIADVAAVVPDIEYNFNTQFGPGVLKNLAIRGVSAGHGDSTTGIYIDDAPITVPYTSFANPSPLTFDMSRVEVLAGPQGTLFGRNAEGGAIRFIPNGPSITGYSALVSGEVETTEGGGNSYEAGLAAGGPIIQDVLGARVSLYQRREGGYVDRVDPFNGTPVEPNANRSVSSEGRIALLYDWNSVLRVTSMLDFESLRLHDSPIFYTYLSDLGGNVFDNGKLLRQPEADGFAFATTKLECNLGDAELTSTSAYLHRTASALVDYTNEVGAVYQDGYGNPLGPAFPVSYDDAAANPLFVHQKVLSQELKLNSLNDDALVSWIGGLFFSTTHQEYAQEIYAVTTPSSLAIYYDASDIVTDIAIYGQSRFTFSPHWRLDVGARLAKREDDRRARQSGYAVTGLPFQHLSASEVLPVTPQIDLSYSRGPTHMLYTRIASGFRPGGFNDTGGESCGATTVPNSYGPDSVLSYEIGSKDSFFNRQFVTAVSAYMMRWSNLQDLNQDPCSDLYTVNAGSALSRGLDITAHAWLDRRLELSLAVAFVDVRYESTIYSTNGELITLRGTVVGGVPAVPSPWSGSAMARYHWPLRPGLDVYLSIQDLARSHNPGPFTELDPNYLYYDPRYRADPTFNVINLQVGSNWQHVELRLTVENLLNLHPLLQKYADAPGSQLGYAYTIRPRTIGLSGDWRL